MDNNTNRDIRSLIRPRVRKLDEQTSGCQESRKAPGQKKGRHMVVRSLRKLVWNQEGY